MKCPIDQTELLMTERHGVEIDYCQKCRGVWLDRGELDKIIEMATPEVALANPDSARAQAPRAPVHPERRYEEPRYEDRREERYQGRHRDDRSEHRRDDGHDDRRDTYKSAKRYKKKRRKSFLEDMFDIFD